MRDRKERGVVIVKPVWWRQACFTLFLVVVSGFFAVVNRFGPEVSWGGTIVMSIFSLLSMLDQVFEWSRFCLLYTSPSPRDATLSRMPSSA